MKDNSSRTSKSLSDLKWLPYALSVMGAYGFSILFKLNTSSPFTFLCILLMIPLFKSRYSKDYRVFPESGICAFIISFFTILSSQIWSGDAVLSTMENPTDYIVLYIVFFFFYEALFYLLYNKMSNVNLFDDSNVINRKGKLTVFFGSMLIMLIMWLPIFIYMFPGIVSSDSNTQLKQAAGLVALSNHHPVMHTLIIKLFWDLGQWLFDGSDVMSVALYSVFQQLALSACFAYLIETLYESKVKKQVLIAVLAFYTIPAYHGVYSITMWKDVLFGGIIAVFTAVLWRLLNKKEKYTLSKSEGVLLFIVSVFLCLMRSNGIYAFIVFLPAAFIVFIRRSKMTVALLSAALICSCMIVGPVYNALGIIPVDTIESLSIPAQLIANVAKSPDNLNIDQRKLLDKVIDVERIDDEYYPFISDNIKGLVREKKNQKYITEHKSEYLKLFCELGIAYPKLYLTAYVNQTYGYWYPDVQYWVILESRDVEPFDIPYFNIKNDYAEAIHNYINSYKSAPFLGLLWSIGFAVWVFLFMAGAAKRRHKKSVLLVYLPVFAIWLTLLIATPVYSEFRYIYSLFATMPLFCIIPFLGGQSLQNCHVLNKEQTTT